MGPEAMLQETDDPKHNDQFTCDRTRKGYRQYQRRANVHHWIRSALHRPRAQGRQVVRVHCLGITEKRTRGAEFGASEKVKVAAGGTRRLFCT